MSSIIFARMQARPNCRSLQKIYITVRFLMLHIVENIQGEEIFY